jgi:hypothetical protein
MSNTAKDVLLIVRFDNKKLCIGISSDKSWKVVLILENYSTTPTQFHFGTFALALFQILVVAVVVIVAADDKSDVAAVVLLVEIDKRRGGHNNYYYGPGRFDLYSQRHLWVVAERMDTEGASGVPCIFILPWISILISIMSIFRQVSIIHIHMGLFAPALVVSPSPYWWCYCRSNITVSINTSGLLACHFRYVSQ